jgi:hypothetical protein
MHPWRTVGRVIPRWVARQQSPPPFHPAGGMYRGAGRRTRATGPARESDQCPGHEGRAGCSEGSLVFCPNNGVHLKEHLFGQPFRTWADLEKTYPFLRKLRPDLFTASHERAEAERKTYEANPRASENRGGDRKSESFGRLPIDSQPSGHLFRLCALVANPRFRRHYTPTFLLRGQP